VQLSTGYHQTSINASKIDLHHNHIIVAESLTFRYRDSTHNILDHTTFMIKQGTITALIGASGNGKTSLLRLFTGQEKINSGSLSVLNHTMNHINSHQLNELRKQIGMLYQFGALFSDLTVYNNIAFPLVHHTKFTNKKIDDMVISTMQEVGLDIAHDMSIQRLSGGMMRKVALARAIILNPVLLLCDEPFTGLDSEAIEVIVRLLKKLNVQYHQSIIVVTHDIAIAKSLTNQIYALDSGKLSLC
jgi:phospholipid/cholesterol/gamma-HCH transport system ATP-binding protein